MDKIEVKILNGTAVKEAEKNISFLKKRSMEEGRQQADTSNLV